MTIRTGSSKMIKDLIQLLPFGSIGNDGYYTWRVHQSNENTQVALLNDSKILLPSSKNNNVPYL